MRDLTLVPKLILVVLVLLVNIGRGASDGPACAEYERFMRTDPCARECDWTPPPFCNQYPSMRDECRPPRACVSCRERTQPERSRREEELKRKCDAERRRK